MSDGAIEYYNGPYLKKNKVLFRHYQNNIVKKCENANTLVILPTGLGKTIIGILLIAKSLNRYKSQSKVIILAPTRPLVSQHKISCEKFLDINNEKISLMTGKIPPEKRILIFNHSKVIISTPQVIKNDLMRGRYDLKQVSLIIFDEAHRTKGNYAYNFISNEYINSCSDPLILGLTASPGKNYEYIQKLCDNLFIENISSKTYDDEDVIDYIHDIDTFIEKIELPIKIIELSEVWNNLFKNFLRFFIDRGLLSSHKRYYSKLDFLRLSYDLTLSIQYEKWDDSEIEDDAYLERLFYQSPRIIDVVREKKLNIQSIFSYCSSCISILHAKDLLETQNISLFKSFLDRLRFKAEQDLLSAKRIINSKHFEFVNSVIEKEGQSNLAHPKINKLISLIKEEIVEFQNNKIIVFTQYREMAEFLKKKLKEEFSYHLKIEKFIGQSSKIDDIGFSQTKQIDILQEFHENKINILIATSVAEEGLDIPNVDAIIFYEPVPSEIRLIQRRGRTGRFASGRCYILITEDTVDVPFQRVAERKEETMSSILLEPEQLELQHNLSRNRIKFSHEYDKYSELDLIRTFRERRVREKELLAERSIEDIITEIDNFSKSDDYKKLKKYGVTFISDVMPIDKLKLKKSVLKMKGKKNQNKVERKHYINHNVKMLINIAETYSKDGIISLSEFKKLASEEEIIDHKFYVHFNQACYLGYLKKEADYVQFIKDYK
jgi:Fanconi anemia group M protein